MDDEREFADLLEVYLTNDGYTVHKFYNGTDALRCVDRENRPGATGRHAAELHQMLCAWRRQAAAMLEAGEITQKQYDNWRYRYPEFDATQIRAKVPLQSLMDDLIADMMKEQK